MLISIDHGNKQIKTIHHAPFTSGLVSSRTEPFNGETLQYQGIYYALSNQRIPYRRDKTDDDRFFVLTLFAIAYELQPAAINHAGIIRIQLAVGLPPAHYGAQQTKFSAYFLNRGPVQFIFHGIEYNILIDEVSCYPQSYAAAVTVFQTLQTSPRALIVDIGGFTADYLQLCNGRADLNICDSLENGVILLYNKIRSKVAAELDLLLDETEIDAALLGQPTVQPRTHCFFRRWCAASASANRSIRQGRPPRIYRRCCCKRARVPAALSGRKTWSQWSIKKIPENSRSDLPFQTRSSDVPRSC